MPVAASNTASPWPGTTWPGVASQDPSRPTTQTGVPAAANPCPRLCDSHSRYRMSLVSLQVSPMNCSWSAPLWIAAWAGIRFAVSMAAPAGAVSPQARMNSSVMVARPDLTASGEFSS